MLGVLLSNDINIEVRVDSLFDGFRDDNVVFFFFFSLCYSFRFIFGSIDNISDLFFFEYCLCQVSLLGLILKASELFILWLLIVRFYSYFGNKI